MLHSPPSNRSQLALFGLNMGTMANPAAMVRVAQEAEAAGYESLWTGEHIVLPEPQAAPSPLPPDVPILDTAVALSWMASATTRVRLGSGIVILPQRQPAVLAKSLVAVDQVSNGRLIFGFGVGYLEPEMTACGTPMADRGQRSDEYLAAMRALWHHDAVSIDGKYVCLKSVTANPKPVNETIPVVVGGHSKAAFRRAIQSAHGWFGFARDLQATKADIEGLRQAANQYDRPSDLGPLEISITPRRRLSPSEPEAFAELGVDRLILQPGHHKSVDDILTYVETYRPVD